MQPNAIKICGIRDRAVLDAVISAGAAAAGLIFFPASPRNLSVEEAAALAAHAQGRINSVAVVVDAGDALLERIAMEVKPSMLQLHGQEPVQRVQDIKTRFGIPIIRAITMREADDIARANAYVEVADMLLFDAKAPASALPGGNGLAFDWRLLSGRDIPLPWFLSGGLNADNVADALRISGARMVDVSSSVESAPGVKDVQRIREFVEAVEKA